jgi:hypothetical protein
MVFLAIKYAFDTLRRGRREVLKVLPQTPDDPAAACSNVPQFVFQTPWFDAPPSHPTSALFRGTTAAFAFAATTLLLATFSWAAEWLISIHKRIPFDGKVFVLIVGIGSLLGLLLFSIASAVFAIQELGLHRLAARTRAFLFGSFAGLTAHAAVHALTIAVSLRALLWLVHTRAGSPGFRESVKKSAVVTSVLVVGLTALWHLVDGLGYLCRHRRIEFRQLTPGQRVGKEHSRLRVAHWSDLHLTGRQDLHRVEGGLGGDRALSQLISQYGARLATDVEVIAVTGDITDAGTSDAWRALFDIVPSELLRKLVVVPGNHDINIVDARSQWELATSALNERDWNLRLLRCILAIDRIQGQRATFIDERGGTCSLSAYVHANGRAIEDYVTLAQKIKHTERELARWGEVRKVPEHIWSWIFPHAVEIPGSDAIAVVLNSNDRSSHILTNAFGYLGATQLGRLETLRQMLAPRPTLVLLHHHLGNAFQHRLVPAPTYSAVSERAMTVLDAPALVRSLSKAELPVFVLNGHRHIGYMARLLDHIAVASARSTTLGDEATQGGAGFPVYELATERGVRLERSTIWEASGTLVAPEGRRIGTDHDADMSSPRS